MRIPSLAWSFLLACGPTASLPDGGPPPPIADASAPDAGRADASPDAGALDAAVADPAFRLVGMEDVGCPLAPAQCASGWPRGRYLRYDSEERFGERTHARTFYVFVPEGVGERAPVWIHLHGGYGSARRMMTTFDGVDLARGAALPWRPNTAACRFDPFREEPAYVDDAGAACEPPLASVRATERAILVLPEGIRDEAGFGRHWETGRVPSPGWSTDEPQRDDVGFLDHVVHTLLTEDVLPVDPTRIALSGTSNGGGMTTRAFCSVGRAEYPSLERIAAFAAVVSAMSEGGRLGQHGRLPCLERAPSPRPILYIAGRGFDTPDASVDGDGYVAWGEPGGRYRNVSPTGGWLLSVPDTVDYFEAHLEGSSGRAAIESTEAIGIFTTRRIVVVEGTEATFEHLATDGGHHTEMGGRRDMLPAARVWAFLGSHQLVDGAVTRGAAPVEGTY